MLGRVAIRSFGIRTVAALALVVSVAVPAQAQRGLDEYEVKAAFLLNFVKFVQWPPSDQRSGAVTIGVVGRMRKFTNALEAIVRGRVVNGQVIIAREMRENDDPRGFHIIFIADSEASQIAGILERTRGAGVLTVGESPDFLTEGGVARFFVEANRVRFQIDPINAQQERLKISSQLLSLGNR
jgi:hypothetical protein